MMEKYWHHVRIVSVIRWNHNCEYLQQTPACHHLGLILFFDLNVSEGWIFVLRWSNCWNWHRTHARTHTHLEIATDLVSLQRRKIWLLTDCISVGVLSVSVSLSRSLVPYILFATVILGDLPFVHGAGDSLPTLGEGTNVSRRNTQINIDGTHIDACETPGWRFIAGSGFQPRPDSVEVSVRTSRPSFQPWGWGLRWGSCLPCI